MLGDSGCVSEAVVSCCGAEYAIVVDRAEAGDTIVDDAAGEASNLPEVLRGLTTSPITFEFGVATAGWVSACLSALAVNADIRVGDPGLPSKREALRECGAGDESSLARLALAFARSAIQLGCAFFDGAGFGDSGFESDDSSQLDLLGLKRFEGLLGD